MPDLDHAAVLNNLPPGPYRYCEGMACVHNGNLNEKFEVMSDFDGVGLSPEAERAVAACLILGEKLLRPPEEVQKEIAVLMAVDKSQVEFMDRAEIGAMLARCELVAHYYVEQLKQAGGLDVPNASS